MLFLQVFDAASNWLEAQTTCIGEGGNLAIIESEEENIVVEGLLGLICRTLC